ncbi:MAG: endo-1,4-beta-xylanase [Actinomycetota bacterium]|nr:endo-1,4-beta-xylanase [Actinomycetota bacterium]
MNRTSLLRSPRRAAPLAVVALLTTSLVAAVGVAAADVAAEADVLVSTGFEDGETGAWSGRGAAQLSVIDEGYESGSSLLVSSRELGWHGPQLDVGPIFIAGTYRVSARVRLPDGVEGSVGLNIGVEQPGGDPEYPWVGGRLEVGAAEWVLLTGTFTVDPAHPPTVLYLESDSATADFLVDDVVVLGPAAGPEPPAFSRTFDFEDGTLEGWVARETDLGPARVEVTSAEAYRGTYAAIVDGRAHQGQGIGYDVTDVLEPGRTYDVSARVKFAAGQPPGTLWLSLAQTTDGATSFETVAAFGEASSSAWSELRATLVMPDVDEAFLYLETAYEGGAAGNTSTFLVDDVVLSSRSAREVQDLAPLKDTVDFPVGVAIDAAQTRGDPAALLLKHFNQVTHENHLKPEAFYTEPWEFRVHPEAIQVADFAQRHGLDLHGHVLVWHGQTPDWFFQDAFGGQLPSTPEGKREMRERLRAHIFAVAEAFAARYGPYGSETNPFVAWDVVNEAVEDGAWSSDGLRRTPWFEILGEEYVALAFQLADEAFNDVYADDGAERPVALFVNDYDTEEREKQDRYLALVERLVEDPEVPIDGVGHQFHLTLADPASNVEAAIERFESLDVVQAVTELDVLVLNESEAQLVEQGHYYQRIFDVFRRHSDALRAVTLWGLTDGDTWRTSGAPLLFDADLVAKPAYYGAAGGEGLPPIVRTAPVFAAAASSSLTPPGHGEWSKLPNQPVGELAGFQARWSGGRLVASVTVRDPRVDAGDAVTFSLEGREASFRRDGSGDVTGKVVESSSGYAVVVDLPLDAVPQPGTSLDFDVRVTDGATTTGWTRPGDLGFLEILDELSFVEVPEAPGAPVVDAQVDGAWDTAATVRTSKAVEGGPGATADVRTLWKDDTLFVLAELTDPHVDTSSANLWEQDSIEIFVDSGNAKAGYYRAEDSQIRVSADNVVSFGTGNPGYQASRVRSATRRTSTGWLAEVAVTLGPFGGRGTFHGLDFQVNDATAGAGRTAVRTWADATGTGYLSTTRWGVAKLVDQAPARTPEHVAPAITREPRSTSARAGRSVTLKVAASGTPVPSVQWFVRAAGSSTWGAIKGATGTSLKVKATKKSSGSSYRAVFSNAAGSATTLAAKVSVKPVKAKVTKHPKSAKNVRVGTKVKLTAKATGAFPAAKVSWEARKPGAKKWTKVKGASKSSLTVVASHKTDGVRYRAVFSNKAGTVRSKAAKVTVREGRPVFVKQPKHAKARAGKAVTFTAQVAASPRARLQWYAKAPGARVWTAVEGARSKTLKVRASKARTRTRYVLIASNAHGWTASTMVRVAIRG